MLLSVLVLLALLGEWRRPRFRAVKLEPVKFTPPPQPPVMRVWTLGSLEHRVYPTEEAVQKLADALLQNPRDLIWGPELSVTTVPAEPGLNVVCGPGLRLRPVDDTTVVVEPAPVPQESLPSTS